MGDDGNIDWQKLYQQRQAVAAQFGEIWDLPVAKRYHTVLSGIGQNGISMLEIGAGDRSLKEKMTGYWGALDYRSCDIDSTFPHDFSDIAEVTGEYDLVCAFELIEHLSLGEAHQMLVRAYNVLKPGGKIALTTPNIFYPPAYLRDATHITPFCYDELGGLVALVGFDVLQVYRLYHDSYLKKLFKRILLYPLFRIMGIDFARQIMVVAQKP